MIRAGLFSAMACVGSLCISSLGGNAYAAGPELVVNGGFESGSFSGWSTASSGAYSDFGVDGVGPRHGAYSAYFGGLDPYDSISQTIATTPGIVYTVSFFLDSAQTSAYRAGFIGSFGDEAFIALSNDDPDFPFMSFSFDVTATSSSSILRFAAYNEADYYTLDDISVTSPVPEPGSRLSMGIGLAMLMLTALPMSLRSRRAIVSP